MSPGLPALVATALAGTALACGHPRGAPTVAAAVLLPAAAPGPDVRRIGTPPWARVAGTWGAHGISHGSIETAAFAGKGRLVTLGEDDGTLGVWDVPSRTLLVK